MTAPPCVFDSSWGRGCRCYHCRIRHSDVQRRYRLRAAQRAHGVQSDFDHVDPGPARDAIFVAVTERGMTYREVGRLAEMPADSIYRIANGERQVIRRGTEKKVLRALSNEEARAIVENSIVPVHKAKQIVLSLCAQGWTQDHQRDIFQNNFGISAGFVKRMAITNAQVCIARNEAHMKWLAGVIGERTGPSKRSITIMRNKGHFPLKHYNVKGDLIVDTLSEEDRAILERVRS